MQLLAAIVLFSTHLTLADVPVPFCDIQSCGNGDGIAFDALRRSFREAVASQVNWNYDPLLAEPTPGLGLPYDYLEVCNKGWPSACSAAIAWMDEAIDAVSTTSTPAPTATSSTAIVDDATLRVRDIEFYTITIVETEYYCAVPTLINSCPTMDLTPTVTTTETSNRHSIPKTGYPSVPSSVQYQGLALPANGTAKSSPVQSPVYGNNASTFTLAVTHVCGFAFTVAIVAMLSD